MKTNGNEPAMPFPFPGGQGEPVIYGLTKREYFAAQFIQGMLAHSTRYKPHNPGTPWMECISREALNLADALIAELNKDKKDE